MRKFAATWTWAPSAVRVSLLCVAVLLAGCDGCQQYPAGDRQGQGRGMCGKCARSTECARGLSCVAGVCETAPPSCHVQIGL